jgi:hypothetical protein
VRPRHVERNQFHDSAPRFTVIFADPALGSGLNLDVFLIEKARPRELGHIGCPNPPAFYKIKGLLPSVDSRKQVLPIFS